MNTPFFILSLLLGVLFVQVWFQDFKKEWNRHETISSFLGSDKFKETRYFILVISLPIVFVNYSGLDGLYYHSHSLLLFSSIVLAFSISFVWYLYLSRVDHFEKEPIKTVLLVFILGAAFTYFVFPISDFVNQEFNFHLNGEIWNDWWYCVFGIGMVEELVKIIPVLIILKYSKQVNEPFDYIFYGSISALGFAFIENTLYLKNSMLTAIYGRALFASVAHMFFTSIICYGLVYFKHIKVNLKGFEYPILLFVASLAHGFYDFWLINEMVSPYYFLTTFFFLASIYLWSTMINNLLNISPFYSLKFEFNKSKVKYGVVNFLITSFYFAYVMTFFLTNKSNANRLLINAWELNVFILLFLAFNLSQIELLRGFIGRVTFRNRLLFFLPRIYSSPNFVGKRVHFQVPEKMEMRPGKEFLRPHFPKKGTLTRRISLQGNTDCYLVQLDERMRLKGLLPDLFIAKLISKEEEIFSKNPKAMVIYGLRRRPDFHYGSIPDHDIVFLHEVLGHEIT
jgi:RsiW-degrading membrane proteinase PrsW (M82 family)